MESSHRTSELTKHQHAEQAILCAMFLGEDYLVDAMDLISSEHFQGEQNRIIFNAIIDGYRDFNAVDLTIVGDVLGDRFHQVGGNEYLIEILNATATGVNLKAHTKIVKDNAMKKRVYGFGQEVLDLAIDPDKKPDDILAQIEAGVIDLADTQEETRKPDTSSIFDEMNQNWRDAAAGKKVCIPINQDLVGGTIPGHYPGQVITIGGYTSVGKTSVLAQLAADACNKHGAGVMIFSVEDSRSEKMMKLVANISGVTQFTQLTGRFSDEERAKIKQAQKTITDWNLLIYDDVFTVEAIRLKIKKAQLKRKVDIVFLDYIQNLHGEGNLYERMSHVSGMFQAMKLDLGVNFVLLSQISNESHRNKDDGVIGYKGGGEIAAATDIGVWLEWGKNRNQEGHARELDWVTRKNRSFGKLGTSLLQFSINWTRIERRGFIPGVGYYNHD